MFDIPEDLPQRLRSAGVRVTLQRLQIAAALSHLSGHRTAEEVHEALIEAGHGVVSIATVYRTMALLCDLRLAAEVDRGRGTVAFEWIDRPHHHYECVACGDSGEFAHDVVDRAMRSIHEETGF